VKHWILAWLILVGGGGARAQPQVLIAAAAPRIALGDTLSLRIFVSNQQVRPLSVVLDSWSHLVPAENLLHAGAWIKSGDRWTCVYTFVMLDTTTAIFPPLVILLPGGQVVRSNNLCLQVYESVPDGAIAALADIRDIRTAAENSHYEWWLFALMLGASGWYLLRVFRKRPAPVQEVVAPAVFLPHEEALHVLERWEAGEMWKQESPKAFFTRLSFLLRTFLEQAHQLPARESTTREICLTMRERGFPADWITRTEEVLGCADEVMYASVNPGDAVARHSIQTIRNILTLSAGRDGQPRQL